MAKKSTSQKIETGVALAGAAVTIGKAILEVLGSNKKS